MVHIAEWDIHEYCKFLFSSGVCYDSRALATRRTDLHIIVYLLRSQLVNSVQENSIILLISCSGH